MRFRLSGLGGHMGSRKTGSSSPISPIAAFTGRGLDSMKLMSMRQVLMMQRAGGGEIALQAELREARHLTGNFISRYRDDSLPPNAISGSVSGTVAGQDQEFFRNLIDHRADLVDVAGSFLHADDIVDLSQAGQRRWLDVDTRASLDAVHHNRNPDARCNRAIVLIQAFLRGLVVVRGDGKNPVDSHLLQLSCQFDDFVSVVAAGSGQHRHFPLGFFERQFHHPQMLFASQRGALARGSAGNQKVDALLDLSAY